MKKIISVFCKIFIAPIVSLLLIKEVNGKENIAGRNYIFAQNHQSYLDIVVSGYVCVPKKFTFIGQVDKGKGILGFLRNLLYGFGGVIPVNRKEDDSKAKAIELAIDHLKDGYSLIIYPEGKRSLDGKVHEGKIGIARLFLETGVPIIPMGINGAYEMYPPKGKLRIRREIVLNIGKPLSFEKELEEAKNLSSESEEYKMICISITEKVMEEIKKLVYEKD
jgi:1-acyl-sn-glycerol-3-phosphate acyltransferase